MELKKRYLGCLIGLAVGDAYGTRWEFKPKTAMPKEEELPDEILGGGPFNMKPGEWTDDTSMALCLAQSLTLVGWDVPDKMENFVQWMDYGRNSVKGYCFDIGGSTMKALNYWKAHKELCDYKDNAGNGCLMRLAPVPMYYQGDLQRVMLHCGLESNATHPSYQSIFCSVHMGFVLEQIFSGKRDKKEILKFNKQAVELFAEELKVDTSHENGAIDDIFDMTYIDKGFDQVTGDGYVVKSWEAALWAFYHTDSFIAGLKKVVSLGEDTDTTGAIYGQIAGAYYGIEGIPKKWVDIIAEIDEITEQAEKLYDKRPISVQDRGDSDI